MHKRHGFEIISNTPERKVFSTQCDCFSPEHNMWVEVEYDKEYNGLALSFNYRVLFKDQMSSLDNRFPQIL